MFLPVIPLPTLGYNNCVEVGSVEVVQYNILVKVFLFVVVFREH